MEDRRMGSMQIDSTQQSLREKYPRNNWWTRQSKRRRIIFIVAAVIIAIAIALGVGLGVGLNQGGGDDSSDNGSSTGTPSSSSGTPPSSPSSPSSPNATLAVNSAWQIVLLNPINLADDATTTVPDVPIWDIDLFTTNVSTIRTLKRLGRYVICYFSAGSFENWRPDAASFPESDKGKPLDGWPGEWWINTTSEAVRDVMAKRIQLAHDKGCDAVDPDNMDGYDNKNGLGLSTDTAVDYMAFLSQRANKLNMKIGLKNAGKIVPDVLNMTDFVVNEQCVQYGECDNWAPYIEAGKPVFHIEYPKGSPSISVKSQQSHCTTTDSGAGSSGFSTVLKNMNLDGFVEYCNGATATTSEIPVAHVAYNSTS